MRSATRKRTGRDKAYLAWIHGLPCAAFGARRIVTGLLDISPCSGYVTAHHAGERGLMQKAEDSTAIPLCQEHHQNGPHAAHRLGRHFWSFHGLDRDQLIADLNAAYEQEKGIAA